VPLIKQRVAPRKKRHKKNIDTPRRIDVRVDDPKFEGRLASEITSVFGPK